VINAAQARAEGYDGAGVTVAFIAGGIDPTNPDFQRNPAYGKPGQPVITSYEDFSGDGVGAPAGDAGTESFLDASSIAAQGNEEYNLAQFVAPGQAARMPASGCWIRILGVAPAANVMALKVFAQTDDTTESGFLQAIQYAVQNGAKVINESFGANNFPDTALDVTREADDAAVADGVTVVVSSGDAGLTSTIGSPATDPNMINAGASTTFRSYAQDDEGGFYNPSVGNGRWLDNNISALSSGGFSEAGNTLDLVAPGDLNWTLCSTNLTMFSSCTNENGAGSPIQLSGGTSEAAPLTSGAAADVIQAYAETHHGAYPSPALVKQILMSTATDVGMPADEQGAGLLNVAAAVDMATSLPQTSASGPGNGFGPRSPRGGILASPNQVNFSAAPGTAESQQISLTNTGPFPDIVHLSTRALTHEVSDGGVQTFTMDPVAPTTNTGVMQIWSGVTEVYQTETFHVPWTNPSVQSRLIFSADYQYTGQSSLLHFALFEPDGTYAAYSLPQGLGDYGEAEVTDPVPGTWTAVFFTEEDGATPDGVGTSGPVQWDAQTWLYAPAGSISPSFLDIAPGQTATATLSLTTPAQASDTGQSIVISSLAGQTTIPVTVRTTIPTSSSGGTFSGVLTGGNGRAGAPAQANFYYFSVPSGETDLDASVALANDPGDELIAYLVDPDGQTVGYSSNYTLVPSSGGLAPAGSQYAQLYHIDPIPGQWALALYWANPVTGLELDEPFTGAIEFNQVKVTSNLPGSASTSLPQLTSTAFAVHVDNTGLAPEAFFVDPRLEQTATLTLANQNPAVTATNMTLPLPAGTYFPYYLVPPHTTQLSGNLAVLGGGNPVTFDMEYFPGDPDVSPNQPAPGVTSTVTPSSASLTLTEPGEVSPGLWLLNPDEIGPYQSGGAPTDTASATVTAVAQAFDPTVTASTDDFWQSSTNAAYQFDNTLYLLPGQTGTITVDITPTASVGNVESGTLYVDDYSLAGVFGADLPNSDELAAIPYSYTVSAG
jgi:hypothetical protein